MQLLFPWGLLGLVLVPVLLLIHRLSVPGRPTPVSFLPLWEKVLSAAPATRTRPRRWLDLLFLLELLIVLLVSLSLAQTATRWGATSRRVALVVDLTASMQAKTPDGTSRWDKARELARTVVGELSSSDFVTLVKCYGQNAVVSELLRPAEAARELAVVQPSDAPGTGRQFLEDVVLGLDRDHEAVFLFTDSLPAQSVARLSESVRCFTVGQPVENVGITAWSSRATSEGSEILVTLENAGSRRRAGVLRLSLAGATDRDQRFELGPAGRRDLVMVLPAGEVKAVRTEITGLDGPDALELDNAVEAAPMRLNVALTGEPSPALDRFFRRVFPRTVALGESPAGAAVDLVVSNGVAVGAPEVAILAMDPPAGEAVGIRVGALRQVGAGERVVAGDDVLLGSVATDAIRPQHYRPLTLPQDAQALFWIGDQVTGAIRRTTAGPQIVLGFSPEQSAWTADPSFVVFMVNVMSEVTGTGAPPDEPFVVIPTGTLAQQGGTGLTGWSMQPLLNAGSFRTDSHARSLSAALLNAAESALPAEQVPRPPLTLPPDARRTGWNPIVPFLMAGAMGALFLWWCWPR